MKQLLYCLTALFITSCFAQDTKTQIEASITSDVIKGHIYFLADDLLKGRETGTPENKIAAAYLANQLRTYGVKPNPETGDFYQEVKLQKESAPHTLELQVNNTPIKNLVALSSTEIDFSGNALFLGYGLEEDYVGNDTKGKVLLIKAGSADTKDARASFRLRSQKEELAKENGALAIIEFLDAKDEMWSFIDHNFNEPRLSVATKETSEDTKNLSYVWVQDMGADLISNISDQKNSNVSLKTSTKVLSAVTSQNVVGIVEGTDPQLKNEYIIYSAHYDHVGIGTPDKTGDTIYNGARDNAVGTTTVLSMAQHLAKHPTKRSALFILFTGEEKGLLGSQYYVDHPILPLNQMVYCFNSDNAGYNDKSLATIIGLPRTTAVQHIKDAAKTFGITAVDDPAPEQGLFDRSDNVHFAKKGIPAPTFSLGFTAFNGDVTKYYHRPGDEADSLDYEYLEKFFRAYVMAGSLIGNDPVTPTWTKGDKYEEAGEMLYGN
jgi:hypothetical protein